MADPEKGRPAQPPRLPSDRMPRLPAAGSISQEPSAMPDTINYDAAKKRLLVGQGYVENVEPAVWHYEVSGKQVLSQWFSYRKAHRERPIIGDRRPPSPLGDIQPDYWLAEYTTELLNVLNVLGWLVDLEPEQEKLLAKICAGPTIPASELSAAGALNAPAKIKKAQKWTKAPICSVLRIDLNAWTFLPCSLLAHIAAKMRRRALGYRPLSLIGGSGPRTKNVLMRPDPGGLLRQRADHALVETAGGPCATKSQNS